MTRGIALILALVCAVHVEGGAEPPSTGNHFAASFKDVVAKVKADAALIKKAKADRDSKLGEIDHIKGEISSVNDSNYDAESKEILLRNYNASLQKAQGELQSIQNNLSAAEARIKKEREEAEENKVAMGMYHINCFEDFNKATFLQPFVVDKMPNRWTNLTMAKAAFTVPLTNDSELTGTFEKARLTPSQSNPKVFKSDPNTSNGITQVENTGKKTAGFFGLDGDEYIWVTFKDGGKIWYKQPREDAWRRRDHADTWMKGNRMGWEGLTNGHQYAPNKGYDDYPDEILLLRAPVKGDTKDVDYSIVCDKRQNEAEGFVEFGAGIIVEGAGVGVTLLGFVTGFILFEPVAVGLFIWLVAGGAMIGDGVRRVFS